jgi:peroxiredoxin
LKKLSVGAVLRHRVLETINSDTVEIPSSAGLLTHLQFRRFAGCPICNLHIRTFIQRYAELQKLGIQEVAVFHSSKGAMLEHHAEAPFALVADPAKKLYAEFGVESSIFSILDPRAWLPAIRGILKHGISLPGAGESPLGTPADFLIGRDGAILALKYGEHAYDQWTIDELLELARPWANNAGRA